MPLTLPSNNATFFVLLQSKLPDAKCGDSGNPGQMVRGPRSGLRSQTQGKVVAKETAANLPSSLQDLIDQLVPDTRGGGRQEDRDKSANVEYLCPACDVVFQDKRGWAMHVQSYHWWRVGGGGARLQDPVMGVIGRGVELYEQGTGLQGQEAGLQGQGAGLQGLGAGLQGQGAELQGQEVGLQGQGAGLQGQGAGLQGQGAGLQGHEAGPQGEGVGLQGQGVGIQGQGAGLQGEGVELQDQGMGLQGQGLGLQGQGAGPQGQRVEPQGQGAGPQGKGVELRDQGVGQQGLWLPSQGDEPLVTGEELQDDTYLQCALCPQRRRTVKEVTEHAVMHRGLMQACSDCAAVLPPSQPHQVRHHLLEHCAERARPPAYPTCLQCGQRMRSTSGLALHKLLVHGEVIPTRVIPKHTTYPCNYCQLSFDTEGPLLRHIIDTHAKNKHKAESELSTSGEAEERDESQSKDTEDKNQDKQNLKSPPRKKKALSVDVPGPPYKCPACNKVCRSAPTYAAHKNRYCPGIHGTQSKKSFLCSLCGTVLTTNSGFRQHMANHTDKHKFSCDICHKTFSVLSQLNFHRKQHGRPFICQTCGKRYKTLSHLNVSNTGLMNHGAICDSGNP